MTITLHKASGLQYDKTPRVRTIPRPSQYTEQTQEQWESDLNLRVTRHTNRVPFWNHEKR